jgi:hypothetical protein
MPLDRSAVRVIDAANGGVLQVVRRRDFFTLKPVCYTVLRREDTWFLPLLGQRA